MNVLIADSSLGVSLVPIGGVARALSTPALFPYMPICAGDQFLICCRQNRDCYCLNAKSAKLEATLPAAPALAALLPSPCGRYLYQLSTEADAVHTLSLESGELLIAAPAGVFPRSMRLHSTGRWLLVAGGAIAEAYLFSVPELCREWTLSTRHPCFAADFWREGLILVCAAEGEDIQTIVFILRKGQRQPQEVQRLPGQPGGLCVCPDGLTALLSTPDGLMKLDIATGRLMWNLPQWALAMKLCCQGGAALISDTPTGQVCLMWHEQPWLSRILLSGADAQACFAPDV